MLRPCSFICKSKHHWKGVAEIMNAKISKKELFINKVKNWEFEY
jgi:hypothetical protein